MPVISEMDRSAVVERLLEDPGVQEAIETVSEATRPAKIRCSHCLVDLSRYDHKMSCDSQ